MSQQDPIDELPPELRAMLDHAREPAPLPPEMATRMLRSLDARIIAEAAVPSSSAVRQPTPQRARSFRAPWQTLAGFVLGALLGAGIYHLLRPSAPAREVVRERVVTREVRVEVPVPLPAPAPSPPQSAPEEQPEAPAPQRHRSHDESDDLAAEQRLIDAARMSLRGGEPSAALTQLDAHSRRYRRGQLAPERELLRVRALLRAGRRGEAEAVAASFLRRYPRHALRPAVEAALR